MSKRIKAIGIVGIILISGVYILKPYSQPYFKSFVNTGSIENKIGCRLFDFNTLTVHTSKGIDKDKIEVKTGKKTVYKKGEKCDNFNQSYGYTVLDVYYDTLLIARESHFKKNNWYTYNYTIDILKANDNFIVKYDIKGPKH